MLQLFLHAAIGVVTYDAFIDVDHIVRRLRERSDRSLKATARVILDASHEARSAIVYAAIIMLLAVAPIYFMNGTSGSYFRPLAVSYGLAIISSNSAIGNVPGSASERSASRGVAPIAARSLRLTASAR